MTVLSRSKKAASMRAASLRVSGSAGYARRRIDSPRSAVTRMTPCPLDGRVPTLVDVPFGTPSLPPDRSRRCVVREEPMLVACWSAKGGSGTTVVAASLARCSPGARAVGRVARRPRRRRRRRRSASPTRRSRAGRVARRRRRRARRRAGPARARAGRRARASSRAAPGRCANVARAEVLAARAGGRPPRPSSSTAARRQPGRR